MIHRKKIKILYNKNWQEQGWDEGLHELQSSCYMVESTDSV